MPLDLLRSVLQLIGNFLSILFSQKISKMLENNVLRKAKGKNNVL